MKKENKQGITLIALVITIIVLLILAGISISLVTGQNGVLTRAEDASNTYSISSAKEQASMRIAGYVSEYMEKVYVNNDSTVGAMTAGEYVLSQIDGEEDGDYRYSVSGNTITVISKTTGQTLATGTVDENGGISWNDTVASDENNQITIPDEIKTSVQNGAPVTVEFVQNKQFTWESNLYSKLNGGGPCDSGNYGDVTQHLVNGNWSTEGLIEEEYTGSYYTDANKTTEYIDMTVTEWKILRINNNGTVDLVPATPLEHNVCLFGAQGYNNGVKLLNDACNTLYGDSSKGITARNINIDDIENMMKETSIGTTLLANAKNNPSGYGCGIYGEVETYENCYAPAIYANEVTGRLNQSAQTSYFTNRENAQTRYTTGNNALTITQTAYNMSKTDYSSALGKYASLLFADRSSSVNYWIASRCAENITVNSIVSADGYRFSLFCYDPVFNEGFVDEGFLYYSNLDFFDEGAGHPLFPIVTLSRGSLVDNGNGTYSFNLD